MPSKRQILANQSNSAKSTGPKSPTGKRRSSQNNLRHGLLARNVVLFSEDTRAFSKLLAEFEDTFQPQDPFARSLVESMAVARWCASRARAMETAVLRHEIHLDEQAALAGPNPPAPIAPTALTPATQAGRAFLRLSSAKQAGIDLISRYEARYQRQFSRTYDMLRKHQAQEPPK